MPYVRKIHLCQDPEAAARHETRGTFFKCLPKDAGFGKRAAKKESNSKMIAEKITVHCTAVTGGIRLISIEEVEKSIPEDMLANQDQDTEQPQNVQTSGIEATDKERIRRMLTVDGIRAPDVCIELKMGSFEKMIAEFDGLIKATRSHTRTKNYDRDGFSSKLCDRWIIVNGCKFHMRLYKECDRCIPYSFCNVHGIGESDYGQDVLDEFTKDVDAFSTFVQLLAAEQTEEDLAAPRCIDNDDSDHYCYSDGDDGTSD